VDILNHIPAREDLPITLQGGEPTLHYDFYHIVNGVDRPMDLLTNLQFDVDEFIYNVSPSKFKRNAPYAAIRASYHCSQMNHSKTIKKVLKLMKAGYQVGLYAVKHPADIKAIAAMQQDCLSYGIDFRTKEFLGEYAGITFGTYKYPGAVGGKLQQVKCKTSELIIGPAGGIYRCHSDLYNLRRPLGLALDKGYIYRDVYTNCSMYGTCNPCDVKVTTNRFQQHGHTSVDIINKNS
jgi:hypothetical protein